MKPDLSKPGSENMNVSREIDEHRNRIDKLDIEIARLLNHRAQCALEVGKLKESIGLDTYQPNREVLVLEHARKESGGPLDDGAITRLFERIIDESRRLENTAEKKNAEE